MRTLAALVRGLLAIVCGVMWCQHYYGQDGEAFRLLMVVVSLLVIEPQADRHSGP